MRAPLFAVLAATCFFIPEADARERLTSASANGASCASHCRIHVSLPLFTVAPTLPPSNSPRSNFTSLARSSAPLAPEKSLIPHRQNPTQPPSSQQQPPADPPPIADNSFLVEEAYNQEYGVVQHINTFSRNSVTHDWEYTFTQEWPLQPAPRHQLSYTIPVVHLSQFPGAGSRTGVGDIYLNWRYQLLGTGTESVWFSPRFSLLLPTGDSRRGRGAGAVGYQVNLPLSARLAPKLISHWNAGFTITPNAKNELDDRATAHEYFFGNSFIWLIHSRFNAMLETVFSSSQSVAGPGDAMWFNSVTINPGFRWAHNLSNGLQIVPGIAFPVEVGRANRGEWGVFLYLSFEHSFKRGGK